MPLGEIAFMLLVVGSLTETGLYFFGTRVLGKLAFVPLGSYTVDVGAEGQEILSGRRSAALAAEGMPREAGSYRSAPSAPLAVPESIVDTLRFGASEESDGHLLYCAPKGDDIVMRLPFKFFGTRAYGLTRTTLSFDGHRVVARTRFLPVPSVSYLGASVLMVLLGAISGDTDTLVFPLVLSVALLVNAVIAFFKLRGPLQMLRLRVESAVYALR